MSKFFNMFSKQKPVESIPQQKDWINGVIELSNITIPKPKEYFSLGWVEWGISNDFPNQLLEFMNESPLHNAIVIGKSKLIAGDYLMIDDIQVKDYYKEAELQQSIILKSFVENAYGENWMKIKKYLALDWVISGSFYLEVIWSNDFSRIAAVNYIPFHKIRPGIKNEEGEIESYFYSEDWLDRKFNKVQMPKFDIMSHVPGGLQSGEEWDYQHSQILAVTNKFPGQEYFGRPVYMGAITDIKANGMISKWNLNSLENGFTPSVLINIPNTPQSKEEADMIIRNIREQFSPRKAMQKIAVMFSNGKEAMPEVKPIAVENIDKQMQELKVQVENSIISGHGVTAGELVGLPGRTGLAPTDLEMAWSIFYNNNIIDDKRVIEEVFNMLLQINGFTDGEITFAVRNPIKMIQ